MGHTEWPLSGTHRNPGKLVLGLCAQVLVVEGYRGGFCKELLEASAVSSQLQDGHAAGQG